MSYILLLLINLIVIFIVWIIINSKIKKNSTPSRIEEYTRNVERLIIELNRALEDVLSISEERINELKSLIKKSERVARKSSKLSKDPLKSDIKLNENLKDRGAYKGAKNINEVLNGNEIEKVRKNSKENTLIEKARHLGAMGYSKDEIAKMLGISPAEVDFLQSLSIRKT